MIPKWLTIAEGELGVSEIHGALNNPRIVDYHKTTTLKASTDEVPWCASFVGWCLEAAGITPTHSAAARSYMNWGKELLKPEFGCIAVLRRGPSHSSGHVGFYVGEADDHVKILSGNQGDKVSIANFSKDKILSYRWP